MNDNDSIVPIPWDTVALDIRAYEAKEFSENSLKLASKTTGHHTIRVNPLDSKQLLHEYGFYYCDTLVEPFCSRERFVPHYHADVSTRSVSSFEDVLAIGHGAFKHGRFHRDFNLPPERADARYDNWLRQLYFEGKVHGLFFQDYLAGFIGCENGALVLHAIRPSCQGHGLAKFLWTPVCISIFETGYSEISSSISASNSAVMNLYASLGFRFRNAVDIYHRRTE